MIKTYKLKQLIWLFLLFMNIQAYPQDLLSKKSMWEINSGIDINVPKVSNYNYIQNLEEYTNYSPKPKDSYIDVNVKPIAVISPYINLCRNELLFNIKSKHIIRGGYGVFFYKKNYQMSYTGSDITRWPQQDSIIHSGKESFNINNFGVNLYVSYFFKISKTSFLLNKFEVNLADSYISNYTVSDTSYYLNNGNSLIYDFNNKVRHYNIITFPFPILTLNYYMGVSFAIFSKFSVTPNLGIQILRKDFGKKIESLFNEGRYLINNHYLFMRAGISLSFKFK